MYKKKDRGKKLSLPPAVLELLLPESYSEARAFSILSMLFSRFSMETA